MKKSILNLGKALNKSEQKETNGGVRPRGTSNSCSYTCSGTTATLSVASRSNNYCILNFAYSIRDAVICGGGGEGGEIFA